MPYIPIELFKSTVMIPTSTKYACLNFEKAHNLFSLIEEHWASLLVVISVIVIITIIILVLEKNGYKILQYILPFIFKSKLPEEMTTSLQICSDRLTNEYGILKKYFFEN
jgi:hypothetical protein